ncbi:hypothetical protein CC1G_07533 [Coprinopsis cinerea okayama7|uniref:Conidiation-specific protein 6 n=1 Tax=Coprinopsis cinerea (strain Okayama-7 / 130 / ATCC MYA-4618 / FGSC 9003) TaxID=240176 RepID=A8P181_COPC7|nr:hypothetical protein CC1G_07533 [Coprinopsis cinerea okayama7\|eukprot:XP_001838043.2 hypothetical protein CC1G_07533 [Coprinopsis cinerea okayama7\
MSDPVYGQGVEPDNVWPARDTEFKPDSDVGSKPTHVQGDPPAANVRRSGKGEYVGMDSHTPADDDDYDNIGRSGGAANVEGDSLGAGEPGRVRGGYKATLSNPRVSKEAKEHAKEVLEKNEF